MNKDDNRPIFIGCNELKRCTKNNNIILCGAGGRCKEILTALEKMDALEHVIAIYDKNSSLKTYGEIPVINLTQVKKYINSTFIAYNRFAGEISLELLREGVKKVYVIYGYGFEDYSYELKKDYPISTNCQSYVLQCGDEYGGFRVVKEMADRISEERDLIVYSFGIGENLSFSKAILDRWNCMIYAFDPTPRACMYAEENKRKFPNGKFTYYPYGLSKSNGGKIFYLPKNSEYVSGSEYLHTNLDDSRKITVEMRTLRSICEQLGHKKIDILKMDIEGSEFEVIEQILDDSDIKIGQICVELHQRFFDDGSDKARKVIEHLLQQGFNIADINAKYDEFTFINCKGD